MFRAWSTLMFVQVIFWDLFGPCSQPVRERDRIWFDLFCAPHWIVNWTRLELQFANSCPTRVQCCVPRCMHAISHMHYTSCQWWWSQLDRNFIDESNLDILDAFFFFLLRPSSLLSMWNAAAPPRKKKKNAAAPPPLCCAKTFDTYGSGEGRRSDHQAPM